MRERPLLSAVFSSAGKQAGNERRKRNFGNTSPLSWVAGGIALTITPCWQEREAGQSKGGEVQNWRTEGDEETDARRCPPRTTQAVR